MYNKNKIVVINDFLLENEFKKLKQTLTSAFFPWYGGVVLEEFNEKSIPIDKIKNFHFSHLFYEKYEPRSSYYLDIYPLIQKINPSSLIRVKANLEVATEQIIENGYHTDNDYSCITAVYYVNTNNGYTKFIDGQKVKSLENTFVYFDSNLMHTGSTCSDSPFRIVINFNYLN
jgi:hypothetical protein